MRKQVHPCSILLSIAAAAPAAVDGDLTLQGEAGAAWGSGSVVMGNTNVERMVGWSGRSDLSYRSSADDSVSLAAATTTVGSEDRSPGSHSEHELRLVMVELRLATRLLHDFTLDGSRRWTLEGGMALRHARATERYDEAGMVHVRNDLRGFGPGVDLHLHGGLFGDRLELGARVAWSLLVGDVRGRRALPGTAVDVSMGTTISVLACQLDATVGMPHGWRLHAIAGLEQWSYAGYAYSGFGSSPLDTATQSLGAARVALGVSWTYAFRTRRGFDA